MLELQLHHLPRDLLENAARAAKRPSFVRDFAGPDFVNLNSEPSLELRLEVAGDQEEPAEKTDRSRHDQTISQPIRRHGSRDPMRQDAYRCDIHTPAKHRPRPKTPVLAHLSDLEPLHNLGIAPHFVGESLRGV